MISRTGSFVIAAAVAFSLAGAPAATASTLTLDHACYVAGQPVKVKGSGFTPGSNVALSTATAFTTVLTNSTGEFAAEVKAPNTGTSGPEPSKIVSDKLMATSSSDSAQNTSVSYKVTNFAFTVSGGSGNPRSTRTFRFSGFPEGVTVWAHYRFAGRTIGTVKMGRTSGSCGLLTTRKRGLPKAFRLRYGTWTIQWDTKAAYSASTVPRMGANLVVFKHSS